MKCHLKLHIDITLHYTTIFRDVNKATEYKAKAKARAFKAKA